MLTVVDRCRATSWDGQVECMSSGKPGALPPETVPPETVPPGTLRPVPVEPASLVADAATRLHRAVVHIGSARLRPWNVTLSSYAALRVLEARPDLTLAQLSLRCFVRPQTMTRMVAQLEKRGWVERSRRPTDDRALSLRLSPHGVTALREMDPEAKKINTTIDRVLTADEIDTLNDLLRRCAAAVEDELRTAYPQEAY